MNKNHEKLSVIERRKRKRPHPVVISRKALLRNSKGGNGVTEEELRLLEKERPYQRRECVHGLRPCPFVSCRYHLYLDINPGTGSIKLNFPDKKVWELEHTCALDIADKGGVTLDDIAEITNLTFERIRQIEKIGINKIKRVTRRIFSSRNDRLNKEEVVQPETTHVEYKPQVNSETTEPLLLRKEYRSRVKRAMKII